MEIKKAELCYLPRLSEILEEARRNIAELGIDQWQKGSPSAKDLKNDIKNGELYMSKEGEEILGFCYIGFSGEPTYDKIYEGKWKREKFATVHRVAVASASRGKGVFRALIGFAENLAREMGMESVRIDTHRGNYKMQSALSKNGFEKMGIIYLENGDERLAFEKEV